jgi:hypothetical protein
MHEMQTRNDERHRRLAAQVGSRLLWLLLAGAGGTGCLAINPTDGVLLCGTAPNVCPSGYQCAADQHCWRSPALGSTGFDLGGSGASQDLSVDTLDASVPTDGPPATSTDMSVAAGGSTDMATKPIVDLAVTPPDMTFVFNYCPAGTIFCDNFETDTVTTVNAGSKWTTTFVQPANSGQTLATGTTQKHDGTHALHAASSLNADSWSTLEYTTKAATALTMRMFVWPTVALVNRGEVARIFNVADTKGYQVGASTDGKWFIAQNLDGSVDKVSTVPITTAAWTCLELVIPTSGNVQLFVNGAQALSFAPSSPDTNGYDTMHAGVEWAPANVPVDVWIDQVTLGTGRLPCP